jgi:hypothetical protein
VTRGMGRTYVGLVLGARLLPSLVTEHLSCSSSIVAPPLFVLRTVSTARIVRPKEDV